MQNEKVEGPYFHKDGRTWYSAHDGDVRIDYTGEELAIAVDDQGILTKHGAKAAVESWVEVTRKLLSRSSMPFHTDFSVVSFESGEEAVQEINNCLNITGYSAKFTGGADGVLRQVNDAPPTPTL